MPNWCDNNLTINGSYKELKRFYETAKGRGLHWDESGVRKVTETKGIRKHTKEELNDAKKNSGISSHSREITVFFGIIVNPVLVFTPIYSLNGPSPIINSPSISAFSYVSTKWLPFL